ncbi:hypothetical protein CALVIDRAFT_541138 [Calocera viscosa TUFC12733]|uniref:N-acetyltransferase domain-containing protein n=1 Tax=Calocera viscosa (strain TUFC12733) TaxID=1330018 RepID=A0A167I592_CALVF|nr:hypothetical protein CALVIDRAFT_541138 [Calocera viscosa TUFC12733]
MSASEAPRLVQYATPSAFLRAALPFDNWHLNLDLGSTLQWLVEEGDAPGTCLWFAVWTGEKLDLTATRMGSTLTVCSPVHSSSLSPSWLGPRIQLLAAEVHTLITAGTQPALSSVRAAVPLVDAFAAQYRALSGLFPEEILMEYWASHCPRSRVSLDPPHLPEGHEIRVVEPGDARALAAVTELVHTFRVHLNGPDSKESRQAATQAELGVKGREYMVYVITDAEGKEAYAGYVRDGRFTSKHAAIRNVFTLPQWRRRGIAEALTRAAVVRLLTEPHKMAKVLAPLLPAEEEAKIEDVTINTANAKTNLVAQGVYRRVGFGFPDGDWDEGDGRSWEDCIELGYPGNTGH